MIKLKHLRNNVKSMKLQEWQKGNESSMTSLQRLEQHTIWLEVMRQEVRDKIMEKELPTEVVEMPLVGFIKD
jgi:hypothetical protein